MYSMIVSFPHNHLDHFPAMIRSATLPSLKRQNQTFKTRFVSYHLTIFVKKIMCFNIVTLNMFLIFNCIPIITWISFWIWKMLKTRKIIRQPSPTLPTTVELCTWCTLYVLGYTFYLDQVLKKRSILQTYSSNQKDT